MELDALDWVSDECFNMLGKRVRVRCTSAEFASSLQRLYRSFSTGASDGAAPDITFSVIVSSPSKNRFVRPFHYVYRDDCRIGRTTNVWYLFRLLEWQTNVFLGENVEEFLLLHAGALAVNGAGIILPAPSESGKTSLTTALTARGYEYMSDEFAVIDPSTGELHPFPKPLSVKNVSLFPDLAQMEEIWSGPPGTGAGGRGPGVGEVTMPDSRPQEAGPDEMPVWYAHPADFAGGLACAPVPLRYILFPRYEPSEQPRLEPVTPGDGLRRLIENSVNFHSFGGRGLRLAAALVEGAECFSLTINGLEDTIRLVDALARGARTG